MSDDVLAAARRERATELLDAVEALLTSEPKSYWLRGPTVQRLRAAYNAVIEEAANPPVVGELGAERLLLAVVDAWADTDASKPERWSNAIEDATDYAARLRSQSPAEADQEGTTT